MAKSYCKDYWSTLAQCPFFKKESAEARKIVCEGVSDTTRIHLIFTGKEQERAEYLTSYCCRDYKQCAVYEMANKKWE